MDGIQGIYCVAVDFWTRVYDGRGQASLRKTGKNFDEQTDTEEG